MAGVARRRPETRRSATRPLPARAAGGKGAPRRRLFSLLAQHRLRQHHPDSAGRAHAGRPRARNRIRAYVRWNAMAMVVRANKDTNVGGHIASFASAATLYDVGFNHFWRATSENFGGDLIYMQGHSAPGIYARAFMLEGRLTEEQMDNFRQEVDGKGLSSYPHPWLMPDFWQFPTVSMGLGPLMAIYQARFMRYLKDRGILEPQGRKVWAFMGDGEMDEPESLGAISLAGREKPRQPDLRGQLQSAAPRRPGARQRQDHPGARGGFPRRRLERDQGDLGRLLGPADRARHQTACCSSAWRNASTASTRRSSRRTAPTCASTSSASTRSLLEMVANMSDDDIWRLNRGGHDPHKIYAAYAAAMKHQGQPTVILAKTIKGYGMGEAGEAQNITHQQKKMGTSSIKAFRDRFEIPMPDDKLEEVPFSGSSEDSPRLDLRERRKALGGYLPARRRKAAPLEVPPLSAFEALLKGTAKDREISTTMAFVRILTTLVRDKKIGKLRGADRAGRIAHLRHGRHVPPARHLLARRPALYAAGCRPADVLQGRQERPDPAGRHQRSRARCRRGSRRPLRLQHARRADDPVLHFLFDVRLPARRRSGLGGGRHARARLPAGRHGGPHHAERRRPAARRRPQPSAGRDHPELRRLRSDLCVRTRGDHSGRPAPHVSRSRRTSITTSP